MRQGIKTGVVFCAALLFLFVLPAGAVADDYYVKTPANGGSETNDGLSWEAALPTIGGAISKIVASGIAGAIHVAGGTYNEAINLPELSDVQLLGGYPADATEGAQQDPWTTATVIDGTGLAAPPITVYYNDDLSKSYTGIVIDGFTVKNGEISSGSGCAGICSYSAGVTLSRCIVESNTSTNSYGAGGIYVLSPLNDTSAVTLNIKNSIIRNNTGPYGGGILIDSIGNCTAKLENLLIHGNTASTGGAGGMTIGGGAQTLNSVQIINCTIADNTGTAAGIATFLDDVGSSYVFVTNSIVWHTGMFNDIVEQYEGVVSVSYSDIQDTTVTGAGVIYTDPAFAGTGDYHLTSESGGCLDGGTETGAPAADLEGTSRPQGTGFDMGCYEFTPSVPDQPDITITDSLGEAGDLTLAFGDVNIGEYLDATVTVTNDGAASLEDLVIDNSDSLATAPFSIMDSTCTGTLDPEASCTFTVRFEPTEAGPCSASFDIASNDPDEGLETVNLSGTGIDATVFYTLTVLIDPVGSGTVTLTPTASGDMYEAGTEVSLEAEPAADYAFDGWEGTVGDIDDPTTTITMDGDKTITAYFMPDGDNDGIPDEAEQGPNGDDPLYDGNNDGTADSTQDNVVSGHTYNDSYYVTLAVSPGETIGDAEAMDNPSTSDTPSGVSFPYGFFEFTVQSAPAPPGESTVKLYLDATGPEPTTYWKYGPEPTDLTDHWYEFLYDGTTGAEFNGHEITLHFVDGERGDDVVGVVDGKIVDQGAPAAPATGGGGGSGGCFISTLDPGL